VIETCVKLGRARAMSLKHWNATLSREKRQMLCHKLFDFEVALVELWSILSTPFVLRRL
jgi:hypothetical protein